MNNKVHLIAAVFALFFFMAALLFIAVKIWLMAFVFWGVCLGIAVAMLVYIIVDK